MLLAGLQEVGHEDVATGRGVFSLRSLKEPFQLFINPASAPSSSRHKCSHCGREGHLPACLLLCLSEANRMLVTKALPHDVAILVFVPLCSRLSFLVNPASGPRSSGYKHSLCGGKTSPSSLCLILLAPDQGPSAF